MKKFLNLASKALAVGGLICMMYAANGLQEAKAQISGGVSVEDFIQSQDCIIMYTASLGGSSVGCRTGKCRDLIRKTCVSVPIYISQNDIFVLTCCSL
jgi:hypothetical protein